ncbi:MAG: hypothetical protein HFI82_12785 [Eubacterium sp.]|nr:hypothetical protein [Eubacterium sp.]
MPDESVRRREQSRINRQPDVPSLTRAAAGGKSARRDRRRPGRSGGG